MKKALKKIGRWIRNIFAPEIMVGVRTKREPVNRHERRALAALNRKAKRKSK